ncbi:MAG: tetratricopeptide repeat protein [bacterium]|nr:tetratricopeptide repeat protein [bacterium]
MYNILPLLLILISLSVIIAIVSRKFSVLAALDVDSIPAEKEAKFKERIISNRLKRNIIRWWSKFALISAPAARAAGDFFKSMLSRLYQAKNDYRVSGEIDSGQIIEQLLVQAEEFKKHDDLDAAEKKYIEIIGFDSKNIKAFKELGQVYYDKKQFEEARQTFEHILKLRENGEEIYDIYFNLAEVYQAMEKYEEAIGNLKQALTQEPANPRYLDTMLEISIIIKDKALALDTYNKLSRANPENNKLGEFKKQIDEL